MRRVITIHPPLTVLLRCVPINPFRDADRMGVAMLMTEFGASENIKGDIYALEKVAQMMDSHRQSWMYWQFK